MENHLVLCPWGFAIPEVLIADMLSARAGDPQSFFHVDPEIHMDRSEGEYSFAGRTPTVGTAS